MQDYHAMAAGIPEFIEALKEARCKLLRGNLPMSDNSILAIASTSVMALEHFPCANDAWEALPAVQKTWET